MEFLMGVGFRGVATGSVFETTAKTHHNDASSVGSIIGGWLHRAIAKRLPLLGFW